MRPDRAADEDEEDDREREDQEELRTRQADRGPRAALGKRAEEGRTRRAHGAASAHAAACGCPCSPKRQSPGVPARWRPRAAVSAPKRSTRTPDASDSRRRKRGWSSARAVPTASIAGHVPRPNASMVSIPSPIDPVLAARAAKA